MTKSDMKKWATEVDTSQTDALIEELQKDYASEKKPWDEIEGLCRSLPTVLGNLRPM